ncbi:MAG TPA: DUF1800 domain-containing protein [Gemmatimonadaceae bacterium]|nr:DUF1800 domain-containing protein [Gemmatimonadaceae bacterium]
MRIRRLFLTATAAVLTACSSAPRAGTTPAPATPVATLPSTADVAVREQTADQQIRQALARLTFGAQPGDFDRVRAMGVDRWIALELDPARIDDHATDAWIARFSTLSMNPADLVRAYPPPQAVLAQRRRQEASSASRFDSSARPVSKLDAGDSLALRNARRRAQRVVDELQVAKVGRALMSRRQLQEVMVDFWENHFSIYAGKGAPERYMLASFERDAIRPHALGKFRDLLGAVAKSPAMLYYLDNWESTVEANRPALATFSARPRRGRPGIALRRAPRPRRSGLNENYGRELLELHTLGVDGGYTQADVIAAARAFTGWTIDRPQLGGGFVFRPALHDAGEKRFLGRTLDAGRGIEDGEQILDILARSPATARFIATKLARRFVSDSPPPALVERAAATFTRTDGDIRETLRTILTSPEFFSRDAYRAKVKSPFELVVSALRTVDAQPDTTPRTARIIARLGEPLYMHRDPNGYPETGDAWINTGSILNRINFGLALAAGRLPGIDLDAWARREGLDTLAPAARVDGVVLDVLGGEASPDSRRVLESGVNPMLATAPPPTDSKATMTADSAAATPDTSAEMTAEEPGPRRQRRDPLGGPMDLHGLEQTVGLALGAPEFQRR